MTAQLTRMKLPTHAAEPGEREELALQAQKVLGYDRLAQAIAAPGALLYTLAKLEIEPLTTHSVLAYKKSKEMVGLWNNTKWAIFFACLLPLLMLVGAVASHNITDQFSLATPLAIGGWVGSIADLVMMIGAFSCAGERGDSRLTRKWNSCQLQFYTGCIPEFVLRKALQIKQACPTAVFTVEQLMEAREAGVTPTPDPFLKVSLCRQDGYGCSTEIESYYIEVWDERQYERAV